MHFHRAHRPSRICFFLHGIVSFFALLIWFLANPASQLVMMPETQYPQDTSALKHLPLFQRHHSTLCFANLVESHPGVALGDEVRDAVTTGHKTCAVSH